MYRSVKCFQHVATVFPTVSHAYMSIPETAYHAFTQEIQWQPIDMTI
jgi:hypothetical protein